VNGLQNLTHKYIDVLLVLYATLMTYPVLFTLGFVLVWSVLFGHEYTGQDLQVLQRVMKHSTYFLHADDPSL